MFFLFMNSLMQRFCVMFFLQGVIVLSRQWKNMLYNPMLFEHQYKNKLNRPINVQFAVPPDEVRHLLMATQSVPHKIREFS